MVKMQNFCVVNDIFNNHTYCLTPKNAFFTTSYITTFTGLKYMYMYTFTVMKYMYRYIYKRMVPVNPGAQLQVKLFSSGRQVPPLWHAGGSPFTSLADSQYEVDSSQLFPAKKDTQYFVAFSVRNSLKSIL